MPKSRQRGGSKTHRKRVISRNQRVESDQNRVRNFFQKEMEAEMEKLKEDQTEIVEVEDVETNKEEV
jgi:hypothetical protein|tara:strand:+ start:2553 stop:2753 length:201 start_codon:yes stop_codon:yes gene_type:complete